MSYSRDKLGRIIGLSRTEEGWTTTREFTFDAVGQLTGETVDAVKKAAYTYSLNGNRLTATGNEVYDEQDRLIANAEWTYNYNANGYLKKKTHQSLGTSVEYIYDNLGNLLQVKTSGAATIDYQVDGENRRISSRVNGVFENG